MVTKKNFLPLFFLIKAFIVIAIMVMSFIIAFPCNAQEQQHLHEDFPNRKVRVGLYENKPKVFTNEAGRPAGIFIELLEDIAKKEKWELVYVPGEWPECLSDLKEGRIDLMPDVAFSLERDKELDFHEKEVIESWSQVYANKKKLGSTFSDLNGRRLALLKGSIQQTVLEQMINGLGYKVSIVEAYSYEEAFTLAAKGSVDMVVSNHFFGDYYYHKYGLVRTAIVFNAVSLYFATSSGVNHDLLEAIDRHLQVMKSESGSVFYKVLSHWMERPPKVVVPRYLVGIMVGICGFLILALVVILLLRRLVIIRTRHLVRVNETLRESEEKFRNIFHNHLAVKLIIDPDNGNIVEANEAAQKFYGWSGEKLRQKRIQDINLLPPEQVAAEMEKAKVSQRTSFEFRHLLADGSIRDVEVFSSRVEIKGKILLHSIVHDITEHRKLEEQYRQVQKMESVGRLAGGVAHDYNNMLNVIFCYTELALKKVEPSDHLYNYLEEILNAAKRSAEITRQLLAFARKQTINPKVLDINESVKVMLNMLRRLIGEDISLVWLPESQLWPVKIDPLQIHQIVVNLCINARDAITGGGKITIETQMVTLDEVYCADHAGFFPGDFVLLAFSDDGCGMSKETLDSIFEPFFTTKDVNQGTGLGLATVYGIVKQNNGFINVYSEPDKGTIFKIYLPRYVGTADKIKERIVMENPLGHGEKIILVEDELALRKVYQVILEKLGYQVLAAATPGEAIRMVKEHKGGIDLLITDVVMPEMNGRVLTEKMTILYPDIKTLFMSGYTADVIAHKEILDEGVNFIQKPFSKGDLAVKVREILDEK